VPDCSCGLASRSALVSADGHGFRGVAAGGQSVPRGHARRLRPGFEKVLRLGEGRRGKRLAQRRKTSARSSPDFEPLFEGSWLRISPQSSGSGARTAQTLETEILFEEFGSHPRSLKRTMGVDVRRELNGGIVPPRATSTDEERVEG